MAQSLQHRIDDLRRIQPCLVILLHRIVLILENVRQAHGADLEAIVRQAGVAGEGVDMCAEAAHGAFLDRDHNFVAGDQAADHAVEVAFLGSQMPGDWALGDFYGPMREETRLFLERVTTGREIPLCDADTGRAVLELTLAMEKSAKAGGVVIELPLEGE